MELILGMLLAFVLGAYVRQPFPLWKTVEEKDPIDLNPTRREKEAIDAQKKMDELINVWNYTGKEQKRGDQ